MKNAVGLLIRRGSQIVAEFDSQKRLSQTARVSHAPTRGTIHALFARRGQAHGSGLGRYRCFDNVAWRCRCAFRYGNFPDFRYYDLGFRLSLISVH